MKAATLALICAATSSLLLAGCALGPNYQRPAVDAPAFKVTGDWKPAGPSDHLPRGKWWRSFGDPTLNELEERLDVSSNSIRVAEAQYRQAQAEAVIARSPLFPTLDVDASAQRQKTTARSGLPAQVGNSFDLGLSSSWELDLWGALRRGAEAGTASAQSSAADLESVRLSLHATLAQSYYSLRITDTQQRLYDRTVEDYKRFLEMTRNRYNQGIDTRADVAAAESQLKAAQAQAVDLRLQRDQLEHSIAILLGVPPATFTLAPAEVPLPVPATPALIASEQLERRPDIAAAERRLAAASANIGVATAGYFPVLSLSASAGYEGRHFSNLISASDEVWALGASLVAPLFNAGKTHAQVSEARAAYDQSLATYRQTVLSAFQEVEDNLAAASLLAEEAKLQDDAVAAARQNTTITLNQYKAGTVSYLNVVNAQAAQLAAERTAAQLLGRRLNASVTLLKAAGGDWHAES
ncbi:MAG TPA: efflux transporter outer membrane subunit [Opitutaceae bacterium]|nr:efflux transporter outer membrane subunit [Opitutaceae bacterium]